MERTHKTWGDKCTTFMNHLDEVSILNLKPKQRCSWHRHQTKFNQFYVISGTLYIKTEWGIAEVKEGNIFTTRPGEWHEFRTGEKPALIQEIMYVKYDPEDIERAKLGGPIENE